MSLLQLTILFSYAISGIFFGLSRLNDSYSQNRLLIFISYITGIIGIAWHAWSLWLVIVIETSYFDKMESFIQFFLPQGVDLTIGTIASIIGLQLAVIAIISSINVTLRGLSGGMLLLASGIGTLASGSVTNNATTILSIEVRSHIFISLFSYGLLTVGAIIAIMLLIQENQLRSSITSPINQLFSPLETTERLLFGITTAGFISLIIAVSSGFRFVDNLFSQHLLHKTVFSISALIIFGILLLGRITVGWRGKKTAYLYLAGFTLLCLAYFGSRYILEEILGKSWG